VLINTHPHPDSRSGRPPVGRQPSLHLQRAQDGLFRAREGDKKRIALGVHLMAIMLSNGGPEQITVLGQDLRVTVPQR
jgi:hypothetical protein